jgi:hypothetical protein
MPRTQPAPLDLDVIGLYLGPPADVNDLLKPVEQVLTTMADAGRRRGR